MSRDTLCLCYIEIPLPIHEHHFSKHRPRMQWQNRSNWETKNRSNTKIGLSSHTEQLLESHFVHSVVRFVSVCVYVWRAPETQFAILATTSNDIWKVTEERTKKTKKQNRQTLKAANSECNKIYSVRSRNIRSISFLHRFLMHKNRSWKEEVKKRTELKTICSTFFFFFFRCFRIVVVNIHSLLYLRFSFYIERMLLPFQTFERSKRKTDFVLIKRENPFFRSAKWMKNVRRPLNGRAMSKLTQAEKKEKKRRFIELHFSHFVFGAMCASDIFHQHCVRHSINCCRIIQLTTREYFRYFFSSRVAKWFMWKCHRNRVFDSRYFLVA